MKEYAMDRFATLVEISWSLDDFPAAVVEAYRTTPMTDRRLRDPIIQVTRSYFQLLHEKNSFVKVLDGTAGFAADIAKKVFREKKASLPGDDCPQSNQSGHANSIETSPLEFDDGSEESSDDDFTYSVREEELPHALIYDVRLQSSLRDVRDHLANLRISMKTPGMVHAETTDISDLYKQVEATSKFEYPETRIVGCIGDSGVGKFFRRASDRAHQSDDITPNSSLINSLFDHDGLARSSGNGNACTSVVTDFGM
ncbi:hypothetical protein BDV12DRAFT_192586 [Aspergillus spectabilis]